MGADSVIIFSANVPPIHATRLDPLMFSNLELKPPLLPGLEGEPYVLPGPRQVELEPSEPFVPEREAPRVDDAGAGRARAEPEF
ncbi:hypothetical protein BH24DEI2_BH24DEI2_10540 [soil metagenome]